MSDEYGYEETARCLLFDDPNASDDWTCAFRDSDVQRFAKALREAENRGGESGYQLGYEDGLHDGRTDERRRVGRQILNPNKLKGRGLHLRIDEMGGPVESLITEWRVRHICGMEEDDE